MARTLGFAVSGGFGTVNVIFAGLTTLMAVGSATGSLALARRLDDQELLEQGQ